MKSKKPTQNNPAHSCFHISFCYSKFLCVFAFLNTVIYFHLINQFEAHSHAKLNQTLFNSYLCPDFAIFDHTEQYISKIISTDINISQGAAHDL